MRVEEAAASHATQTRARNKRLTCEDVARHCFFAALATATRTATLPVERFECFSFRCELVLVPLDQLQRELGVHLFEPHVPTVV